MSQQYLMSTKSTQPSKKSILQFLHIDTLIQLYRQDSNPWPVALTYLLLLTLAEITTVFMATQVGILLNLSIMFLLLVHTALLWEKPIHRFLLSLTLVPLIRIISLSLPLTGIPLPYWYLITSIPLFAAAVVIMRQIGLPWSDLGWGGHHWGWQLPIAASGVLLGYLEYRILKPEPLVDAFTIQQIWFPATILLISTGYLEELIFRRIMQRTAVSQLGVRLGIMYVALFFAILHIGYRSLTDFVFVLIIGLVFGLIVQLTDNIIGVTVAHGLTNISLFLIFPFILSGQQTQLVPLAQNSPPSTRGIVVETTPLASPTVAISLTQTREKELLPTPMLSTVTFATNTATPSPTPLFLITSPTTIPITVKLTPTPAILPTAEIISLTASTDFTNVNVRPSPSLDHPAWAIMTPKQVYEILAQDSTGGWILICCFVGKQPGWVDKSTVDIIGNTDLLEDLPPPIPQIEISVVRLNARTEPNVDSDVIGIFHQGERYDLISQDSTGTWYQICCSTDVRVWVFADGVTVWGDFRNVPLYQK